MARAIAGERRAALADEEVVAALLAHDEVVRTCKLGSALHLFIGRARLADADVLGNRAVEQTCILEDDGHRGP